MNGSPVAVLRTLSRSPKQKMKVVPIINAIIALGTTDHMMDLCRTLEASWTSSAVVHDVSDRAFLF